MRSPFVLAACVAALRIEIQDQLYSLSRMGFACEECDKLHRAEASLTSAELSLRNFHYIKKVEDLPESEPKASSKSSLSRAGEADKSEAEL